MLRSFELFVDSLWHGLHGRDTNHRNNENVSPALKVHHRRANKVGQHFKAFEIVAFDVVRFVD